MNSDAELWPRPMGMRKFLLMSFFTLGLYDVYWFYWNWKRQRERSNAAIRPMLLAFLSPFVAYRLFRDVRNSASDRGVPAPWHPALLAFTYFLLVTGLVLPGWWWLLTLVNFVPLIPVQQTINVMHESSADAGAPRDDRITATNLVCMIVGTLVMALLIAANIYLGSGAFEQLQKDLAPLLQQTRLQ